MKTFSVLVTVAALAFSAVAQEMTVAAQPASDNDIAAAVRGLEEQWEVAVQKHDSRGIDELLANDFAGVSHQNRLVRKVDLISGLQNGTDTYSVTKVSNMKVHVFAPNVAVAIGEAREKGKDRTGKSFDRSYRFTDTWVERKGRWQCVAAQVAQVGGR